MYVCLRYQVHAEDAPNGPIHPESGLSRIGAQKVGFLGTFRPSFGSLDRWISANFHPFESPPTPDHRHFDRESSASKCKGATWLIGKCQLKNVLRAENLTFFRKCFRRKIIAQNRIGAKSRNKELDCFPEPGESIEPGGRVWGLVVCVLCEEIPCHTNHKVSKITDLGVVRKVVSRLRRGKVVGWSRWRSGPI